MESPHKKAKKAEAKQKLNEACVQFVEGKWSLAENVALIDPVLPATFVLPNPMASTKARFF